MVGALNNFLMDKTEFPEPEKFIPERWLNNLDLEKSKFFTPFGVGPRICVGRYLAESESRLIVANFLQRFSIAPFEAQSIPYTDGMSHQILLSVIFNPLNSFFVSP